MWLINDEQRITRDEKGRREDVVRGPICSLPEQGRREDDAARAPATQKRSEARSERLEQGDACAVLCAMRASEQRWKAREGSAGKVRQGLAPGSGEWRKTKDGAGMCREHLPSGRRRRADAHIIDRKSVV